MPEQQTATQKTVKYAGNSVGVGLGNAIAYFGLQYAEWRHGWKFADPVVAMAMAGAIMSAVLLEAGRVFSALGRAAVYVFDRVFPEKR
jgi:hypothetical protein